MACQTLSLATLLPRGHKTSPLSQGIAGTRAGIALWESGAQLLQLERGQQRQDQGRGQGDGGAVDEATVTQQVNGRAEPWRRGSWTSNAKGKAAAEAPRLLKLTPTWSHGSQVDA